MEARCSEFSREWRCSWSNADRRCSNYIWVINNFIVNWGVTYIRDLMVLYKSTIWFSGDGSVWPCFAACVPGDLICNVTIVSGVIRYASTNWLLMWYATTCLESYQTLVARLPGAKIGTWKSLRVQGFMIDPDSIVILKKIKLGCHNGNLGELFLFA